ncbi:DNA-binding protein WhiA [Microbacterium esteraromaticum]|uniref:Probable cell division protein WhiA n=1 Tax=Microbacterium esteraromaticum TaxID=57043 RepID=A0A939ITN3_9MICO|nr:DNA-binding protein WhiA [Microbacterium esteraromaticum]MBN7792198.1 DNA-binding protein WhiA [Microbacterium esteraromaticum]MBN8206422.1 DNA-binding protein WhiA [Microbacterium esteraromaticum]MBN8416577.1 DNA-binding protein WhiA [Microbacterium esteraromaticum]MBN8423025.1 DNA-binding protein WhiA [Microbacterium esteraromaticum]MCA1308078.1 DNA-binding protein WhiA [Microbacterium esteraromaticum]
MALTTDVKAELVSIRNAPPTVRVAEVTTILRFAGGLHSIAGRVAVEAEVDAETLAKRVTRDLAEIYGVRPEVAQVKASSSGGDGARWAVRVIGAGETLARQTGLLDARRRPVRGLPNRLTTGSPEELGGILRGAFLAAGTLSEPGRSAMLEFSCPSGEAAMALVGAAHRLGIAAKAREVRGLPRVVVREGESIQKILTVMGARRTAVSWEEMRQRREVRAGVNRLVNFDDANLRRSAQAAVAACARVERALQILGDEVPDHLRMAGNLRLAHRDASLDELGHHAEPPLTKDAVAGRIRRLLAMADKRAQQEGIPGTEAAVPVGIDD